jgi:hypothetical protein
MGGEQSMAETRDDGSRARERVPRMQMLLDDVFLLLLVGLTVPTVVYIAWGLVSLLSVPALP